eukprot:CAMPEP_0182468200 /NCGR_PEP_ID=MMETSP1319-20130603/15127_1 /TAXON_ID=172717 /ORGANISM="Bolidomonas pacifica, Strain RCC208" /LENGTH=272 /DNA_ID=CAMNT_0024668371 /DNA_START=183 /DNA_END=997 /DNA_ORIENTATION=-
MGDDLDGGFDFDLNKSAPLSADIIDDSSVSSSEDIINDDGMTNADLVVGENDADLASPRAEKRKIPDAATPPSSKKKNKKNKKPPKAPTSNASLLHSASSSIATQPHPSQLAFLTASLLSSHPSAAPYPPGLLLRTPLHDTRPDRTYVDLLTSTVLGPRAGGKKRLKRWSSSSPLFLVLCLSARRATSVLKDLTPLRCPVNKLWSKNMKEAEQAAAVRRGCRAAVGTPNRVLGLVRSGGLSLAMTELVVVDCEVDGKGFNVVSLKDTAGDLG